jgi:hypothetical protein
MDMIHRGGGEEMQKLGPIADWRRMTAELTLFIFAEPTSTT